jgi:hypothetical protein
MTFAGILLGGCFHLDGLMDDSLLVLFGLYTGQRLGDLAALTWVNVDLAGSKLHLITRSVVNRLPSRWQPRCGTHSQSSVGKRCARRPGSSASFCDA